MKPSLLIALLSLTSSIAWADTHFGGKANLNQLQALASVMQTPAKYAGQTLTVKGVIKEVCHKKGCWMELSAGEEFANLIVKVKDGDMVFPISARGKTAYATGVLSASELDIQATRAYLAHRAEENQLSFDPKEVTEGMTLYRLKPSAVSIID